MSKVKKEPPKEPAKDSAAQLEDKIAQVSDRVSTTAKQYRMPIIIGAVVIVAILGLFSIFQWFEASERQQWGADIDTAFGDPEDTPDTVRPRLEALAADLKGSAVEPYFVNRYAHWLWVTNETPKDALKVLEDARTRHADNLLIEEQYLSFKRAIDMDEGFEVPAPPPPPAEEEEGIPIPPEMPTSRPTTNPYGDGDAKTGDAKSSDATTPEGDGEAKKTETPSGDAGGNSGDAGDNAGNDGGQ